MCYKLIGKGFIISLLLVTFAMALGASTKYCPWPEPVRPESYSWNFPKEANQTLADFETHAREIRTQVAILQTYARVPGLVSPVSHANALMLVRERVNHLGTRLCRLLEIERVTDPWQQSAIRRVRARLSALAETTEAAIGYLNDHRAPVELASRHYREYLDGMYQEADLLCHCVVESELEYAVEIEE